MIGIMLPCYVWLVIFTFHLLQTRCWGQMPQSRQHTFHAAMSDHERVVYLRVMGDYCCWCIEQGYRPMEFNADHVTEYVVVLNDRGVQRNGVFQFLMAVRWFTEMQLYMDQGIIPP